MRRLLLACVLLLAVLAPAAAGAAEVEVEQVPVSIRTSLPDDQGNPVVLDGGVDFPAEGCPCPGVIINHGFLGNWTNSGEVAHTLAAQGYVVLRYSSRGFGRTPGQVDLMGPKERQDLLDAVHWLNDKKSPVVGGLVRKNRIGQFGGSYGGAHAWSLALANDHAVRTVVPTATWTDLYDALMPNDVELLAYANGFYATGLQPVAKAQEGELDTTNNYSQNMHRWVAEANAGVNTEDMKAGLDARSVAGRYGDIRIPVFIVQGTNDGLFSQNQAVDAYRALAARGVPARLYVGGIGHPPSNSDLNSPEAQHVSKEILAWFDHYLKGADNGIDELPPIEYSRSDYFDNAWDGTTRSAKRFPLGPAATMHLCATGPRGGTLATEACPDAPPAVAAPAGTQGLFDEPVTAGYAAELRDGFVGATGGAVDPAGATPVLTFDSAPLTTGLDLTGAPAFRLQVASLAQAPLGLAGGAAAFQLDPKLYDVGPDGAAKLITRGAFSEPLDAQAPGSTPQHEVRFDAFGASYALAAGHRLRIALATSDAPYLRPTPNPFAVAVLPGSSVRLPSGADMQPTPPLGPPD
jgi:ABC-2 type transport system ATP-binding protein